MSIAENLERQRLLKNRKEKGSTFLGTYDFCTEHAVLIHVPTGKCKTTQIRCILERRERSLIFTHRTTLTENIHAKCKKRTELKHYAINLLSRETKAFMGGANQLICQLESIHYLHGAKP